MGHVISRRLRAVRTPFIPAATTSKAQTCRRLNRVSVSAGIKHHSCISPCHIYAITVPSFVGDYVVVSNLFTAMHTSIWLYYSPNTVEGFAVPVV